MTRASSRFAIGAMAAILALGRDDPLVVAMPERHPEPPQEKVIPSSASRSLED